jgi:outer membrane lipoprotein-sorting protein
MSALQLAFAMVLCATSAMHAVTLEEILAKALEARGGKAALAKVQSVQMSATTTLHQAGIESAMTISIKRPNRYHASVDLGGTQMVQCFDGTKAWYTNPMSGKAEELPETQAASMRDQGDLDGPLVDWAAKGNTVTLAGVADVDGVKAHKIVVKDGTGSTKTIYIDTVTYAEIKNEMESSAMGQTMTVEIYKSDFRQVGAVWFPFRIETKMMGMTMSTTEISDLKLNVAIDNALFAMPK